MGEFETTFNYMEGITRYDSPTQETVIKSMPVVEQKIEVRKRIAIQSTKYESDINTLKEKYGNLFVSGLCITISLHDLLEICPRGRRRIEAYNGLVSVLEKQGIKLTITSRKTKVNYDEQENLV